ncbi:hypothetical protein BCR44DRAFT_1424002 [Catenaria anguillulae PL171]|uniref:Uncharacterized protein n=1 Tax=Catenaria anguillulae PL171 TaxID=765915 RepID=A0A1Y2I5X4_9FUNG|nr:hypothetical protein BCR44DRAFT_1424002 [Catenaria anguillulae PL171]
MDRRMIAMRGWEPCSKARWRSRPRTSIGLAAPRGHDLRMNWCQQLFAVEPGAAMLAKEWRQSLLPVIDSWHLVTRYAEA